MRSNNSSGSDNNYCPLPVARVLATPQACRQLERRQSGDHSHFFGPHTCSLSPITTSGRHASPRGDTALLNHFTRTFFGWLFPLAGNARMSIATRILMHLPLTLKDLFGVRVVTLFIPPYSWIILFGSLGICYPVFRAQHPLAGLIASLLFILFSALVGLTIAQLLTMKSWRRLLFLILLVAGVGIIYLASRRGMSSVMAVLSLLPTTLVTRAALGRQPWLAVLGLTILTSGAFVAALWSFKKSLETTPKRNCKESLDNTRGVALRGKNFVLPRLLEPISVLFGRRACSGISAPLKFLSQLLQWHLSSSCQLAGAFNSWDSPPPPPLDFAVGSCQ